jgi:hypothetical protein
MGTNPPDVCTNTAYLNSINQKTRFQLFNIPAVRYDNLANNPYEKINVNTGQPYTKDDLDMRRKAEILKYSSNRMSTQTNNLTKAQKFAQAVNGYSQQSTLTQAFINANIENGVVNTCPPGTIIKTPSSASGVPGSLLLYDDPTIPIYNLVNDTTASGIINQLQNPYSSGFKYSANNNVMIDMTKSSTLFTTYIFNTPTNKYSFSFTTPILIQFYSSLNSDTTYPPVDSTPRFQITLNYVDVNVNYSFSPISLKTNTISYVLNNTTMAKQTILDISLNPQTNSFNGSYYLGTITVSNIVLPVSLGYIYDFQLSTKFSVNYPTGTTYPTYYKNPTISSVLNVTDSIKPSSTNCIITPNTDIVQPPNTNYAPFSVSGTSVLL